MKTNQVRTFCSPMPHEPYTINLSVVKWLLFKIFSTHRLIRCRKWILRPPPPDPAEEGYPTGKPLFDQRLNNGSSRDRLMKSFKKTRPCLLNYVRFMTNRTALRWTDCHLLILTQTPWASWSLESRNRRPNPGDIFWFPGCFGAWKGDFSCDLVPGSYPWI